MGGWSARARKWVLYVLLFYAPWIALNVLWLLRGDLVQQPGWSVIINVCIAFFGIAAPAIDRRFDESLEVADAPTPTPRPVRRQRRRAA